MCNYHQQFYRPENLCVIITGQIDPKQVFETVKPFEDKILSKASKLFQFSVIFNYLFSSGVFSECIFKWLSNLGLKDVLAVYLAEK